MSESGFYKWCSDVGYRSIRNGLHDKKMLFQAWNNSAYRLNARRRTLAACRKNRKTSTTNTNAQ
jgi:hypothetical protein